MSFIRPEISRASIRWFETAAYAAVTVLILWWLSGAAVDVYWRGGLMLGVGFTGFWLTRAAYLSARAATGRDGPGMVLIDERRITYLGPEAGGFASINALEAIELWAPDPPGYFYAECWILRHLDAPEGLIIPTNAEGAGGLIDAFAALPGFEADKAVAALGAAEGSVATVWRRAEPQGLAIPLRRT